MGQLKNHWFSDDDPKDTKPPEKKKIKKAKKPVDYHFINTKAYGQDIDDCMIKRADSEHEICCVTVMCPDPIEEKRGRPSGSPEYWIWSNQPKW